jgi:hypothetical protein
MWSATLTYAGFGSAGAHAIKLYIHWYFEKQMSASIKMVCCGNDFSSVDSTVQARPWLFICEHSGTFFIKASQQKRQASMGSSR